MMRKIIHIDMDAFFASIEQRDNKSFRGKPLAVGYPGLRGVVAAASYQARKYGVHSAMPSQTALKKCPELIFTPARFHVYKEVSHQIRSVFSEYTDLVEPLSLDEAFLDVTQNHKNIDFATDIALEIKKRIYEITGLTASAGVSFNKFLAKIASDYNKPDGIYVITPKKAESFVEKLTIERFFGIGKKTTVKMHQMGIFTGDDLKQKSEEFLIEHFGKAGKMYFLNARGIDPRIVNPNRKRKSIGTESTFDRDIDSFVLLQNKLEIVVNDLFKRINNANFKGKTITLKAKYSDFRIVSKSKTLPDYVEDYKLLSQTALSLFGQIPLDTKIRLLGLTIKNNELPKSTVIKSKNIDIQLKLPFEE